MKLKKRNLFREQAGRCIWCGDLCFRNFSKARSYASEQTGYGKRSASSKEFAASSMATIEHIKPASNGGTREDGNVCIACADCNNKRGNRVFLGWDSWVFNLLPSSKQRLIIEESARMQNIFGTMGGEIL